MSYIARVDNYMAEILGEETYRVGGSVRDEILGRRCKDGDYVVRERSLPELYTILHKAGLKPTLIKDRAGHKLGFRINPKGLGLIEIVLPRTERKIDTGVGNERHKFQIIVDPNLGLQDDAVRRDFTFNAIYRPVWTDVVNGWGGRGLPYVDPLGGVSAIDRKLIQTTHPSSFKDDPLRILRAIRFISTLGFSLETQTSDQMAEYAPLMGGGLTDKGVSGTVMDEINKTLMGDNVAEALRVAARLGVLVEIMPELAPLIAHKTLATTWHDLDTWEHTLTALDAAARMGLNLRTRWSLLLHDSGKPLVEKPERPHYKEHEIESANIARKILARLNAPRELRRDVPILAERHMVPISDKVRPTKVRRWRCELGDAMLSDLLKHRLADCMGRESVRYDDMQAIARLAAIQEDAIRMKVPASPKDLKDAGLINGKDLIEMGLSGDQIGKVLDTLLHEVVSQPDRADREWLLRRANTLREKL